MRFHVVSLPHTQVTTKFAACAFTQKVLRFCQMMGNLGHEVILYASDQAGVKVDELVTCISESERQVIVGNRHYTEANWDHPLARLFNRRAAEEIGKRIRPQDFICLIGGRTQQIIADTHPGHISVEFGIGYSGTFAKYRVFESYAWMHMVYGAESGGAGMAHSKDGNFYDAVIPNQIDPELFPRGDGGGDYFLYVGRLIDRKGYKIAQEVCERMGKRLILAGPGTASGYGEFIGEVGPVQRAVIMGGAYALFAPTQYVEPFGTVHIEAMACGTPVISTDWGVFTETIQNGVNGQRCRLLREFIGAAEAAVIQAYASRDYIRSQALQKFGIENVAYQYEEYFNRLLTLWGDGWYSL